VLVFLPSFALLGLLARRLAGPATTELRTFFYGREIWSAGAIDRWIWRRRALGLVTISAFSAGALSPMGPARILRPGIVPVTYEALLRLPACQPRPGALHVLSVFRLVQSEGKGAFCLLEAAELLRGEGVDCRVTFAGVGPAPTSLASAVTARSGWAQVVPSPTVEDLVALYGQSDIFVLATRLRASGASSGEGFGIVLVEAALAGRPVVAPVTGGSSDAIVPGVTGLQPLDESAPALADVLRWCVAHPDEVGQLAESARSWARAQFDPNRYADRVRQVLFGAPFEHDSDLAVVSTA
jgi:glycosyltransferase involved in cell wall biosynthesis